MTRLAVMMRHAVTLAISAGVAVVGASAANGSAHVWNPSAAGASCMVAIAEAVNAKAPEGQLTPQLRLGLSTGTALPNDAGKFQVCVDGDTTRYFMVSMTADLQGSAKSTKPLPLNIGLCLPKECTTSDIPGIVTNDFITQVIPALGKLTLRDVSSKSPDLDVQEMNNGGIIAVGVVSCLAFLVVFATVMPTLQSFTGSRALAERGPGNTERSEGLIQVGSSNSLTEPDPERPTTTNSSHGSPLLNTNAASPVSGAPRPTSSSRRAGPFAAFAMFGESGTIRKLFEIPAYKPTDSLNGLRVVSMAWIILGHTFLMPEGISGYLNPEGIVHSELQSNNIAEDNPMFMFVLSAQVSVDTFFFLSGFLLSLLTLQELRARRGQINLLAAAALRYVRLTPSLALAMLVYYKIWAYLGTGPFAAKFQDSIFRRCDESWWSELTYTLNFIPFDSDKVCMGWTWYLGDDMIFFLVGIIILPLYYRRKVLGWLCIAIITGASFAVTMWLVWKYKLSVYVFDDHYKDYSYYAYSKPYTRIPAYFVGMASAWVLDNMERIHGITRPLLASSRQKTWAALLAFLSFATMLFIIIIPATDFGLSKNSWGALPNMLYIAFSRPLWAACWAVITILCYYDLLPLVNSFLAHRWWTPLARLTYGAYLVHPMVIKLAAGRSLQFYHFSTADVLYRWVGNCIMAYMGSAALWVLVERPAMTMTSALLKKKPPQAETKPLGASSSGFAPQAETKPLATSS
jgi:peptidoglycan/LPS O-acetylase OafA/YrhL